MVTGLLFSDAIQAHGEEEAENLPSYSTPGRVLFRLIEVPVFGDGTREIEIIAYDNDSGVFWASEGVGLEYLLTDIFGLEDIFSGPPPIEGGVYVLEGVYGEYTCGEWGYTDADEDWYYGSLRPATEAEIADEALGDLPS